MHTIAENIVPIVAIVFVFGGSAIQHFVRSIGRAIELKAQQQSGVNSETTLAIEELRREVAALRETSTRFDMSFDAAITRLEQRMNFVEGQTIPAQTSTGQYVAKNKSQSVTTLGAGRGA